MVRREAQSPPLSRYPTKSVVHFDVQGAVSRSPEFLLYLGSSMKVIPVRLAADRTAAYAPIGSERPNLNCVPVVILD